jgi:hypothetical protein
MKTKGQPWPWRACAYFAQAEAFGGSRGVVGADEFDAAHPKAGLGAMGEEKSPRDAGATKPLSCSMAVRHG